MEKIKIVNREFYSLELLRLDLEYFQLKGDFFEQQSHLWSKLITNQERELDESLKELQELIVKLNDRNDEKEQLASHLKHVKLKKSKEAALTSPQKVLVRKNGFFNCPECSYKTIYKQDLNQHINAVHRKLKPWKCSECDKG